LHGAPNNPRKPVILVVDDEDYVADMLGGILQNEEYTVLIAYNGLQGLNVIQEHTAQHTGIDLLILDIMMPYLGGEEVLRRVQNDEHTSHIPIILISAGARPQELPSGVVFIAKPFDLDQFLELVQKKIRER
jgi:CheY-like chemotaxis protein